MIRVIYLMLTLLVYGAHVDKVYAGDFKIASGGIGGKYYVIANYLCKYMLENNLVNVCNNIATEGSVNNLELLSNKEADLILSQEDAAYFNYKGDGEFFLRKNKSLRKLFTMYSGTFNIIVRKDSDISDIYALKGRRLELFGVKSGTFLAAKVYARGYGYVNADYENFNITDKPLAESFTKLCNNEIDAVFSIAGHISPAIKDAFNSCELRFLDIPEDKHIDKITEKYPFYNRVVIPALTYKGQHKEVKTLGVYATIITNTTLSEDFIYYFMKIFYSGLPTMAEAEYELHFNIPKEVHISNKNNAIPYHPGAIKFFREINIIK